MWREKQEKLNWSEQNKTAKLWIYRNNTISDRQFIFFMVLLWFMILSSYFWLHHGCMKKTFSKNFFNNEITYFHLTLVPVMWTSAKHSFSNDKNTHTCIYIYEQVFIGHSISTISFSSDASILSQITMIFTFRATLIWRTTWEHDKESCSSATHNCNWFYELLMSLSLLSQ